MEREMNLKRKRSPSSSSASMIFEEETEDRVVVIDDIDDDDDDDEIYENMKMEKFYELIRTFRDARGQFCSRKTTGTQQQQQQQEEHQYNKEKMKKKETSTMMMMTKTTIKKIEKEEEEEEEEKPVWVPSFKREDFSKEIEFRNAPHPPPPLPSFHVTLSNVGGGGVKKEGRSLDLKLTL